MLSEKITSKEIIETGKKIIEISIDLTLKSPSQGQLAYSEWRYNSGGSGPMLVTETINEVSSEHSKNIKLFVILQNYNLL